MRCTLRVLGYEAVNTGSKIAARYRQSRGEVNEEAMMVLCPGRRFAFCLARELLRLLIR